MRFLNEGTMPPPRRKSKIIHVIKPAKKTPPRGKLDYQRADEIGDHRHDENIMKSPKPKKLVIIERTIMPKRETNKPNSRYMVTNNVLSIDPTKDAQPISVDIQNVMEKARKNINGIKACSCSDIDLSIHLPNRKHSQVSNISRDVDIQVSDTRKLSLIEASARLNCMWAKILETSVGYNILKKGYCTEDKLLKNILTDKVVQTSKIDKAETATDMKSFCKVDNINANNGNTDFKELFFNDKSIRSISEDIDKQVNQICHKAMMELNKLKDNFSSNQSNSQKDEVKLVRSDEWITNLKKDISKRKLYEKRTPFRNVVNSEPLFDEKAIQLEETCVDMYVSNIHSSLCSIVETLRSLQE